MIGLLVHDRGKTSSYSVYLEEILFHAGLPFARHETVAEAMQNAPAMLLSIGRPMCSTAEYERLARFIQMGGTLIQIGDGTGLDKVLGVRYTGSFEEEGWLTGVPDHPVTRECSLPLHAFAITGMKALTAMSLGTIVSRDGANLGDGIAVRQTGKGLAVAIAPDVATTIVRIQQGIPVERDGVAAPDGTAPIDDGILKAEDGMVLDWERDRQPFDRGAPFFQVPVADEWRKLLVRFIWWGAGRRGVPLPMLWYWPGGLSAVGHLSLDSDLNEDEAAMTTLRVLDQADVKATWCVMYPGGYRSTTYTAIRSQGHELALHYNAMKDDARSRWGEDDFDFQWHWLQERSGVPIVTNKNHYLRWEGETEFYRWCERRGIRVDQTKGPTKQGDIGFLFGSCHPWFPIEQTGDGMRRMDVLEIPLLTQDLVWTVPFEVCHPLLEQCVRHHGVAHFLFHPHHIHTKPEVARAVIALTEASREMGLAWWTAEAIDRWERLRRQVDLDCRKNETDGWEIHVRSPHKVSDATLLILAPDGQGSEIPPLSFFGLTADRVRLKRIDGFDFYEVRGVIQAGDAYVRVGGDSR
ncbi:hypothetical protein [Polycladomyces subterraneus]|uniref:Uncharacterized protein n=1 Tax=Polycladomyces subterraneus TaxID=1016997 RepID=A0ABT8IML7_9BACL|nr:hypothetical protein [Polycladomyces subterraneus]MDN4593414.1 hypothetical protein [Polycladomyces subterraneus]